MPSWFNPFSYQTSASDPKAIRQAPTGQQSSQDSYQPQSPHTNTNTGTISPLVARYIQTESDKDDPLESTGFAVRQNSAPTSFSSSQMASTGQPACSSGVGCGVSSSVSSAHPGYSNNVGGHHSLGNNGHGLSTQQQQQGQGQGQTQAPKLARQRSQCRRQKQQRRQPTGNWHRRLRPEKHQKLD